MTHERFALDMDGIGLAYRIVLDAHLLLNAVLDNKAKAECVRDLAYNLQEFRMRTCGFEMEDDDMGPFYAVLDGMRQEWDTVRIEDGKLIMERDIEDERADANYWPGSKAGVKG